MTETLPVDYPTAWAVDAVLADGSTVHIRPIRPDDAPAHRLFFSRQSAESVYNRFFSPKKELNDAEVAHFTTVDYHDRMAFAAFLRDEMIGIGRYDRLATSDLAEVAFAVADDQQGRGIGSLLLEYLAAYAPGNGITRFCADTLAENHKMLEVFKTAGYRRESQSIESGVVHLSFEIEPTGTSMAAIERRAWVAGVHSIQRILEPTSVAVIGAGRDPFNIGHTVVRNLINAGFTGPVYPINPNAAAIGGVPCYPSVEAIPGTVDLAVIAVPAEQCLAAVDACAIKGVHGLVVISSGFAEVSSAGAEMQRQLVMHAHRGGMRIVGPNCFGVINTSSGIRLNTTFASQLPVPGRIAFGSQSGALGIAVLEHSVSAGIGLSSFVSMGNKCDVSSNDLLRYWNQDGQTRVILLYLESFGNPRAFARVAPIVSRTTPIVVVKSGRSTAGTRAAASHTAALASPDTVVDALFNQAGVIRVDTLEELLDCGALLGDQPPLAGRQLAIIGNAGGAAVLAADACAAVGLNVPQFDQPTQDALRAIAGPNAGVSNPIDLGAAATPRRFAAALSTALNAPGIDGAVVIMAQVASTDSNEVAREVAAVDAGERPVVFVHLGTEIVPPALKEGTRPIPCYAFPERAIRALGRIAAHSQWKQRPKGAVPDFQGVDLPGARAVVDAFLATHPQGGWLTPGDCVRMLQAFGIPTVGERHVESAEQAAAAAEELGFPVALKGSGDRLLHKSDVGAVRLDLNTADDVRQAYLDMAERVGDAMEGGLVQPMLRGVEVIAGVLSDSFFGPVVMFGSGGVAVELFGDRVFRILPMTDVDAHEMVRSTRGAPLLAGYRGAPACDIAAVEEVLLRVAQLADEVPQLAEMDLNPLIATPKGCVAVDARIRIVPWHQHAETEVRRLR